MIELEVDTFLEHASGLADDALRKVFPAGGSVTESTDAFKANFDTEFGAAKLVIADRVDNAPNVDKLSLNVLEQDLTGSKIGKQS